MSAGPIDDAEHAVIDVLLVSRDDDQYVLVLVEQRPWTEPGVLDHLTDRVDRTVAYVLDGHLADEFPETVGRSIRVDVRYEHRPPPEVEARFARFAEALSQRGMEFSAEELG